METTAGSVTSAKQFVWDDDNREEERDGAGILVKRFFDDGQNNGSTNYFYTADHLGSVREMIDNSGVTQAQYAFDPCGRVQKIAETVSADYGYGDYYLHSRSGLSFTLTRPYNCVLSRFMTRDEIEEEGGVNLYAYVSNDSINSIDPSGHGLVKLTLCMMLLAGCLGGSDACCRLLSGICIKFKCKSRGTPLGGGGGGGTPGNTVGGGGKTWTQYWTGNHPSNQPPFTTHRRYHPNGDIKSVQTYDKFGRRDTRFDLKDTSGRPPHRHDYQYGRGRSGGQPSDDHAPLDQIPEN